MSIGFAFSGCSFFYIFLLVTIFFSKKRFESLENKIYSYIIISNLFGVIFALSSYFGMIYQEYVPILNIIVSKTYIIYLLVFMSLFTIYIFIVSLKTNHSTEEEVTKIIKKITKIFLPIFIVLLIVIIILPLYYHTENNVIYSYGPSANFMYFIGGFDIFIWLILMVKNFKNLKNKKYLPIFVYVLLGTVVMIVQRINPGLLLMTSMQTFITFLMYFTIENPDMKMIEQLNEAKDRADKANSAKSDFLSSMSHEIRTPLNAIVGFSQSLKEEALPDSAKEDVDDIIMASESLLELVNGILDISKIEANKLEIINSEYSFKRIFNELVALTKARLNEKSLDFRFKCDESIPEVLYGDHARLKQIILNLLTNAVKYTKEGYIDFTISSVVTNNVCRLIINVEDSGIGIKKENIDKLFTKFERLDVEKNTTVEGTGLGLAITKKLVELMGGKIVVQSEPNVGSKFTVAVDQRIIMGKKSTEVLQKTQNIDLNVIKLLNKKILVVDDNTLNLKVASRLLQKYNVGVAESSSGFDCLERISSGEKFDLILLDDMMPKMSGVETFKKLKETPDFNIPVVVLTANAISGMREKYINNDGFNDYLAKPIELPELNRIIKKYLQNN